MAMLWMWMGVFAELAVFDGDIELGQARALCSAEKKPCGEATWRSFRVTLAAKEGEVGRCRAWW